MGAVRACLLLGLVFTVGGVGHALKPAHIDPHNAELDFLQYKLAGLDREIVNVPTGNQELFAYSDSSETVTLWFLPSDLNAVATAKYEATGEEIHKADGKYVASLAEGENTTIAITVTAVDTVTSKTWQLTFKRASSDTSLSAIMWSTPEAGQQPQPGDRMTLPAFNPGTNYVQRIGNAAQVSVAVLCVSQCQHVWVGDGSAAPVLIGTDTDSPGFAVAAGHTKELNITVLAEDGMTYQSYSVGFYRDSDSTEITAVLVAAPADQPAKPIDGFQNTNAISHHVGTAESASVTIDCNRCSKVTIQNATRGSGEASQALALPAGTKLPVRIVITAEDETTKATYTLSLYRASSDASLQNLRISAGELTDAVPAGFAQDNEFCSLPIAEKARAVGVVPTCNDEGCSRIVVTSISTGQQYEVKSGQSSKIFNITDPVDIIKISVTAEDELTKQSYFMVLYRGQNASHTIIGALPTYEGNDVMGQAKYVADHIVGELRFLVDFDKWLPHYTLIVAAKIADVANVDRHRVTIMSIKKGSVIVQYAIQLPDAYPDAITNTALSLLEVFESGSFLDAIISMGLPDYTTMEDAVPPGPGRVLRDSLNALAVDVRDIHDSAADELIHLRRVYDTTRVRAESTLVDLTARLDAKTAKAAELRADLTVLEQSTRVLQQRLSLIDTHMQTVAMDGADADADHQSALAASRQRLAGLQSDLDTAMRMAAEVGQVWSLNSDDGSRALASAASEFASIALRQGYAGQVLKPSFTDRNEVNSVLGSLVGHLESAVRAERDQQQSLEELYNRHTELSTQQQMAHQQEKEQITSLIAQSRDHTSRGKAELASLYSEAETLRQRVNSLEGFVAWTRETHTKAHKSSVDVADQAAQALSAIQMAKARALTRPQ